ncbi:MAG TPA: hypothetical protein VFT49_02510 [Candidatus Saccharimonadales bacterium]|nr:hypothetical protein [Candidatus Saccharimonadales bacterium]
MRKMALPIAFAIIVALVATTVAFADNGNKPQFSDEVTSQFHGIEQYGLAAAMKLNDHVSDGQTADFWLTVRRTSGDPTSNLLIARLGWNFCGSNTYRWTDITSAQLGGSPKQLKKSGEPAKPVKFADSDGDTWMRIGMLRAKNPFVVWGHLKVPDRSAENAPQALMLCMVLEVRMYNSGTGLDHKNIYTDPIKRIYTSAIISKK